MNERAVYVQRWTQVSIVSSGAVMCVIVLLALVPVALSANAIDKLNTFLVYLILAAMWNALAGYAGLVSVGQQMFFGLGAYFAVKFSNAGVGVYQALVLGALCAGATSVPLAWFMLRLRGGEFAIGMWVVSELVFRLVILDQSIGGLTGTSLGPVLETFSVTDRRNYNYWLALGAAVLLLGTLFVLLRSRTGASLQAIRDDEEAAASVGVRVLAGKGVIFVLAAFGCAAAGVLWLATNITYQPDDFFNVKWTAYMLFMALVGGLGTFEGPIIGAVVFFLVDDYLGNANYGVWYLVGLGTAAILFALVIPRGIWGTVEQRIGIRLLPVGYWLRLRRADVGEAA